VFVSGLRNPNGLDFEPQSGALWAVVNGRDELGSDLVLDYLTSVKDGGFYGWPFSYWGQHVDTTVPENPETVTEMVAKAIVPDYALGNHVAPLLSGRHLAGAIPRRCVHRRARVVGSVAASGYKVVFAPFANGRPAGMPMYILSGFVDQDGRTLG
jgi:glucose/arabinose dehydrogenase